MQQPSLQPVSGAFVWAANVVADDGERIVIVMADSEAEARRVLGGIYGEEGVSDIEALDPRPV